MIPSFAPGCYGSALTFKAKEKLCMQCPFNTGCEVMHYQTKEALCGLLGVPYVGPKTHVKTPLPDHIVRLIRGFRVPALNLLKNLAEGINPFKPDRRIFQVACHVLLKSERAVTDTLIAECIAKATGKTPEASLGISKSICVAFAEMGAITYANGIAKISKG